MRKELHSLFDMELRLYSNMSAALKSYGSTLKAEVAAKVVKLITQLSQLKQEQSDVFQKIPLADWMRDDALIFFINNILNVDAIDEPDRMALFLKLYKLTQREQGLSLIRVINEYAKNVKLIVQYGKALAVQNHIAENASVILAITKSSIVSPQKVYAGTEQELVLAVDFIAIGHELIHFLHYMGNDICPLPSVIPYQPRNYLYSSGYKDEVLGEEFLTIQGTAEHTENKLRQAFGFPQRASTVCASFTTELGDTEQLATLLWLSRKNLESPDEPIEQFWGLQLGLFNKLFSQDKFSRHVPHQQAKAPAM